MSRQHKGILCLVVLLAVGVLFFRYFEYVVAGNFSILANTMCDPEKEACFVMDCSPEDEGCDQEPYKKIKMLSREAPRCLQEHSCSDTSFCDDTSSCEITYCTPEDTEDGEVCAEKSEEEDVLNAPSDE